MHRVKYKQKEKQHEIVDDVCSGCWEREREEQRDREKRCKQIENARAKELRTQDKINTMENTKILTLRTEQKSFSEINSKWLKNCLCAVQACVNYVAVKHFKLVVYLSARSFHLLRIVALVSFFHSTSL